MSSTALLSPMPAWNPAPPRRRAAAAVLALHLVAAALLLQAGRVVAVRLQAPPLSVRVIDPTPPAPPRAATLPNNPVSLPMPPTVALPTPEFTPLAATREAQPAASPPAAPAIAAAAQAEAPAPRSATIPKTVAANSLRWRVEPAVELPRLSRRAGEQGQVQLRVVFDPEGRPQQVQLQHSSGFARLDAQALEAMQVARIAPYLEDGHPRAVLTLVRLEYELE